MNLFSKIALFLCCALIITGFFYKPRWNSQGVHATISWDVSGYYIYLPAIFIYQDLEKVGFKEKIHKKYRNSSHAYQTHTYKNGNEIGQYTCGMAVQYLPFFLVADALAEPLGYERDGYTFPYQLALSIGGLLIAFLGLFYLRKSLLYFFSDTAVGVSLLIIVFSTNYLNYAAIDGAMTHNSIFTLFSLLIWNSIHFHKRPTYWRAAVIGFIIGLATLTRPPELLMVILAMLWGASIYKKDNTSSLSHRFSAIIKHFPKWVVAGILCCAIASVQMLYWKIIGGDWIINSYQEAYGFDWLNPHLYYGIFSYKKGWLVYTPIMIFALVGLGMMLWRKHTLSLAISLHFALVLYVTFAWSCWWYGGSLGQRALVQYYAPLAFPLCYFVEWVWKRKYLKIAFILVSLLFTYYNIWLHHQAHHGGMLNPDSMTRTYYWQILGKWKKDKDDFRYLDTNEKFRGERKGVQRIYFNDFENDSLSNNCSPPIAGKQSFCIKSGVVVENLFYTPFQQREGWVRVGGKFKIEGHSDAWKMHQLIIKFKNGNNVIKNKLLRVPRLLEQNVVQDLYLDAEIPKEQITDLEIGFWSAESEAVLTVDDLYLEFFE